jgi:hypothetical protein
MVESTMLRDAPESARELAQLEHVCLENEKLKLELAKSRDGKRYFEILSDMVAIITAFVAVSGLGWAIFQYQDEQQKNRDANQIQSDREKETREKELMKPWLSSQREIYLEALSAAATVVNCEDPEERKKAADTFWQLYHGKMILVETKSVSDAMVVFGRCLDGAGTCDKALMNERCHDLGTAMAESIAATAGMTYEEFSENQFKNNPTRGTGQYHPFLCGNLLRLPGFVFPAPGKFWQLLRSAKPETQQAPAATYSGPRFSVLRRNCRDVGGGFRGGIRRIECILAKAALGTEITLPTPFSCGEGLPVRAYPYRAKTRTGGGSGGNVDQQRGTMRRDILCISA